MSIGIAVAVDQCVLLVADGRRVRPLASGNAGRDDVVKLRDLGRGLGAIDVGVVQASELVPAYLIPRIGTVSTLEALEAAVLDATKTSWSDLTSRLAPDVDRANPAMRVGVIVGGLLGHLPVVAGALVSDREQLSTSLGGSESYIVLGGEAQNADAHFARLAAVSFKQFGRPADPQQRTALVQSLVANAKAVIREVERFDPTVGGIIHCAVVGVDPFSTKRLDVH